MFTGCPRSSAPAVQREAAYRRSRQHESRTVQDVEEKDMYRIGGATVVSGYYLFGP
jgi:hypothetical protein